MIPDFKCWQKSDHSEHFNTHLYYPTFGLDHIYGNTNEFLLLERYLPKAQRFTLSDIGCATGEISRYLHTRFPRIEYTGFDISESAISTARRKYPNRKYVLLNDPLEEMQTMKADYIFSRDVILHQKDPYGFLRKVCSLAQKGVFLRIRTRDKGSTVLDVEQSCQINYGMWAPYIVLNCDEFVRFLTGLNLCKQIVIIKNYMILGGVNNRFLPKECYLEETGTAETAVFIEIEKGCSQPQLTVEARKEPYAPPLYLKAIKRLIQHTVGPRSSHVWW